MGPPHCVRQWGPPTHMVPNRGPCGCSSADARPTPNAQFVGDPQCPTFDEGLQVPELGALKLHVRTFR